MAFLSVLCCALGKTYVSNNHIEPDIIFENASVNTVIDSMLS